MSRALVIAGPSAVGKTTVAEKIMALSGGSFELSRSLTTRGRRGDAFDDEYIYTTRQGFERELSLGRVLEYTEYSGELYGTPLSEIERIEESGKTPLLILDLNGVKSVSERTDVLSSCAVYLYCDNETLQNRLLFRYLSSGYSEEGEMKMKKRLEQNLADFSGLQGFSRYFYAFVKNNGCAEETANKVLGIFSDFSLGKPSCFEENTRDVEKIIDNAKSYNEIFFRR